jgi:hypothetical protein
VTHFTLDDALHDLLDLPARQQSTRFEIGSTIVCRTGDSRSQLQISAGSQQAAETDNRWQGNGVGSIALAAQR